MDEIEIEIDDDLDLEKIPPQVYKGKVFKWFAELINYFGLILVKKTLPYVDMYSATFELDDDDDSD